MMELMYQIGLFGCTYILFLIFAVITAIAAILTEEEKLNYDDDEDDLENPRQI